MSNNILLECQNLKKYFETPYGSLHAVDDISFQLEEGKTLGVVGESGCGKSTLGRIILQLLKPTSGKVIFNGKEIQNLNVEQMMPLRREMQIIFQDPYSSLNPRMTVAQLIAEPLRIHKVCTTAEEESALVSQLMETVGLADRYVNTYPHEMDGGRRQRVGIARALALNPKFIVCDEPVSALDVSIQAQIVGLMMRLQEELGLTYIFIGHDLSVVRHISDQVAVMYLGKIMELTSSDELYAHPLHPYTQALISAAPIPDPEADLARERILLEGEVPSPINPPLGCNFCTRCRYADERCRTEEPPFLDVGGGHFVACHRVNEEA